MAVRQNQIYTPYCYLIGWTKQNKYYYGVRYAEDSKCLYDSGCHPDDLWVTYYTSSEYVAEMRKKYGEPDVIKIRRIFSCKKDALNWENKVIIRIGAVQNLKWLNKRSSSAILMDDIVKDKIRKGNTGKIQTIESRTKISKTRLERKIKHTIETKEKLSKLRGDKIIWSKPFIFKHNDKIYEFLSMGQFLKEFGKSAVCIYRVVWQHQGEQYILTRKNKTSTHPFLPGDVLYFQWKHDKEA
jgi:hypothetical protein